MRLIHLWRDRDGGLLVSDIDKANPLESLSCVQDEVLSIVVHNLRRNRALVPTRQFIEEPAEFEEARASIVLRADAPPSSGTFKLRVGDQTTAALTWPADTSTAQLVATWKASVLTALKALSNVGASGIFAADPAGSPANLLYFRWADLDRDDLIDVVENRLLPPCAGDHFGSLAGAGFTQLLKLSQLPYKSTTEFTRPTPPAITIIESQPGGSGVNEEQMIVVPASASGAVAFRWSGATTKSLAVTGAGLTATAIASALNAIVANGATNPSFAVEQRATANGLRFAVRFIGPLAAAAQASLEVVMLDQVAWPYTVGTLDLRDNLGIETALNGAPSVELLFELVLGGDERYLLPITIANSATSTGVEADIIENGGIVTITETVIIDESTADPFVTATQGLDFPIPDIAVGASEVVCTHDNWGRRVPVIVFNQTAVSPETWRECKPTEYGNSSASDTATKVTFPFEFSDDEDDAEYIGKWKIRLINPNASVSLNDHDHTWDHVRASLPAGETLTARLAAIASALGMLGGSLSVDASKINGLLSAAQIDLSSVATSLVNQSTFATALGNLFASNATLVTALVNQLGGNTAFATTLTTLLGGNTAITSAISQSLSSSSTFVADVRNLVFSIIQGSGNLPAGSVLWDIEAVSIVVPEPQEVSGPSITRTVPTTQESTVIAGSQTSTVTRVGSATITEPGTSIRYVALSPSQSGALANSGGITGRLPSTGDGYYAVTGFAESRGGRGRRGARFATGCIITYAAGHWYQLEPIDGAYYATEAEQILIKPLVVDETMLFAGSRFALSWTAFFQLASSNGTLGTWTVVAEISEDQETWTEIFASVVKLSPTAALRNFGITVTRASGGAVTGEYTLQGQATAFTPPGANFTIRARLTKFTCSAVDDPRGSATARIAAGGASASIVAL